MTFQSPTKMFKTFILCLWTVCVLNGSVCHQCWTTTKEEDSPVINDNPQINWTADKEDRETVLNTKQTLSFPLHFFLSVKFLWRAPFLCPYGNCGPRKQNSFVSLWGSSRGLTSIILYWVGMTEWLWRRRTWTRPYSIGPISESADYKRTTTVKWAQFFWTAEKSEGIELKWRVKSELSPSKQIPSLY